MASISLYPTRRVHARRTYQINRKNTLHRRFSRCNDETNYLNTPKDSFLRANESIGSQRGYFPSWSCRRRVCRLTSWENGSSSLSVCARAPALERSAERVSATEEGSRCLARGASSRREENGAILQTGALGRRRSDESNERRGGRRQGRRSRRSTSAWDVSVCSSTIPKGQAFSSSSSNSSNDSEEDVMRAVERLGTWAEQGNRPMRSL